MPVLSLALDRVGIEGALAPHRCDCGCACVCDGRWVGWVHNRPASAVSLSLRAQSKGVGSGRVDRRLGPVAPLTVLEAVGFWAVNNGVAWVRGHGKLGSLSYDSFN